MFKVLSLPFSLSINKEHIEDIYHKNSRMFHPDFFTSASEEEKAYSLQWSSLVNKAYKSLRNPVSRADYIVGYFLPPSEERKKNVSPDILMEVMELNELIEEAGNGDPADKNNKSYAALSNEKKELEEKLNRIENNLYPVFEEWDAETGITDTIIETPTEKLNELLNRMQDEITKYNYYRTVFGKMEEVLGD